MMDNVFLEKCKSADIDFTAILRGYLSGILGAITVFAVVQLFHASPYKIGTVNITEIVDQFVKYETRKNAGENTTRAEVKKYGLHLESELKQFSKENHLVLFPSEAVISGSQDYTVIIQQRMHAMQTSEDH